MIAILNIGVPIHWAEIHTYTYKLMSNNYTLSSYVYILSRRNSSYRINVYNVNNSNSAPEDAMKSKKNQ